AAAGVGARGVGLAAQADGRRRALVDRAVVARAGRGRHVVDVDRGGVLAEAVVLVDDAPLDGVVAEIGRASCGGGGGGWGGVVVGGGDGVAAVGGVAEAAAGVGARGVGLAAQADGRRRALVDRAVVARAGRGRHVVDVDRGGVLAEAVVLVDDAPLDGVVA